MLSRSEQPEAWNARQREHRLAKLVRPKVRPGPNADPWLICEEALDILDRLRGRHHGHTLDDIDEVAERIKQLATGPDSEERGELG